MRRFVRCSSPGQPVRHAVRGDSDVVRWAHRPSRNVSVDQGVAHVAWYDSRNDPAYSPARPIGNDASGQATPALDVYAATSLDG